MEVELLPKRKRFDFFWEIIMESIVRSALGAAFLLTGASTVMAASDTPTAGDQAAQTSASTTVAASDNVAVADQTVQTAASTAIPANSSPLEAQSRKARHAVLCDNTDAYGGHGPKTLWGKRAFWELQQNSD